MSEDRKEQGGGKEREEGLDGGLSLVHRLAEAKARGMFADLMASAGVGYNQIAKEVFFFMPQALLDVYEDVWYTGLAGKDDGVGGGGRGVGQAQVAAVGKAATQNQKGMKNGKVYVSSGGSKRKGYKKYWVIADEEALEIKDRFDKRLRGLAREMGQELFELKWRRSRGERDEPRGKAGAGAGGGARATRSARVNCESCGRLMGEGWKFCSSCGHRVAR